MKKSENFGFNLPSSDSNDIVDVNLISDNFRMVDEELFNVKENIGNIEALLGGI